MLQPRPVLSYVGDQRRRHRSNIAFVDNMLIRTVIFVVICLILVLIFARRC